MKLELTGRRFGALTVTGRASSDGRHVKWLCSCDCGSKVEVTASNLTRGHTQKCRSHPRAERGDKAKHPLWNTWRMLHRRCTDSKSISYQRYGGKGVSVCEEWSDFWRFVDDMGAKPSPAHTLDRWPNSSGNYEPSNCRWATPVEQTRNSRTPKLTESTAAEAKARLARHESRQDIAASLGVSSDAVRDIDLGRTWKDVQPFATMAADGVPM